MTKNANLENLQRASDLLKGVLDQFPSLQANLPMHMSITNMVHGVEQARIQLLESAFECDVCNGTGRISVDE